MSFSAQDGAAARIAELERELSDFSYQSSHDVVAPFRHVNGYASLLGEALARNDLTQATRYSGLIARAADECQQRLDNLLLYSRAQGAPMAPVTCDITQLVGLARLRQSSLLAPRGMRLNVSALGSLEVDAPLFEKALDHILRALALFRPPRPEGYTLAIAAVASAPWRLAITDDGPPLNESDVARAFAINLAEPGDRDAGVWGIDLAIARRIFRRHGGDVVFVPSDAGMRLEAWLPQTMEIRDE